MSDGQPEPDRVAGAPHPRETARLIGQGHAEREFLDAFAGNRLHHAWLLTGPLGVGKATLAWRMARFLLATAQPPQEDALFGAPPPPATLDIDPNHPVAHRIHAGSEPGLFALRRPYDAKTKRLKAQITVDEVRRLKAFFALSSADGGHRVVIVDSADDMNVNAANALLKLLEEPPARTTLLLISHQPSRLLPTIRSRCRTLRLSPLTPDDMTTALTNAGADVAPQAALALAELSAGSVGEAIRLENLNGLQLYADLIALLGTLPRMDRPRALALAETGGARGKPEVLDLMLWLLDTALARLARTGATGAPPTQQAAPGESTVLARLAPHPQQGRLWAQMAQDTADRTRHARAVNVDPASLLLDAVLRLQDAAAAMA